MKPNTNKNLLKWLVYSSLFFGFLWALGMTLWDYWDNTEINWGKLVFFALGMSLLWGLPDWIRFKRQGKARV